jgi:hypothetical protein
MTDVTDDKKNNVVSYDKRSTTQKKVAKLLKLSNNKNKLLL